MTAQPSGFEIEKMVPKKNAKVVTRLSMACIADPLASAQAKAMHQSDNGRL
jgi:hypothetical protein